jgi:selenoprotein W-related protein
LSEYKMQIERLELVPDKGGCFELLLNGDLVYSKLKTGEFPDESRMIGVIGKQLKVCV